MQVNDVCARPANTAREAGADWRRAEAQQGSLAPHADAPDCLLRARATAARGDDDARVHFALQALAEVAQVRLHPALVRRVELAYVQHPRSPLPRPRAPPRLALD